MIHKYFNLLKLEQIFVEEMIEFDHIYIFIIYIIFNLSICINVTNLVQQFNEF